MSPWTVMPDRAAGYAYAESDWDALKDNLNTGVWVALASSRLASPAASFDFQSINQTFSHLMVMIALRNATTAPDSAEIRLNNDTGANYDYNVSYSTNTSLVSTNVVATTHIKPGLVNPTTSHAAGFFTTFEIYIPHYTNTTGHKAVLGRGHYNSLGGSSGQMTHISGWWRSTVAVSRVTIAASSIPVNFDTGARATLFGLP